ncbi:hypothetical protein HNP52_000312 [Sphingomonas kyeonggiensis]|uniref:J domain-containing protein n=1 Tax=Sphingomonas kyeonggiensis TaxID=1268553 RepID=A0A7W7JY41_9SPHN|nr:J domain-containing protein [Sphingomonas kyeonggiensis]MBB4837261.1 hypothetical protein [Sphingomonas kyeonggiensis]
MATAFPLAWPFGLPRTEAGRRVASQFKTELPAALKNVQNSLRRFGEATGKAVSSVVISSNYTLGVSNPADPGVAVWFLWDGKERCIAVDRYPRLQHNLQAIHHVLEARVTEARHGGLRIVQQTFTGFVALPAPADINGRTPAQVLGIDGRSFGREDVIAAHRALAMKLHPDRQDGDGQAMADLNAARDALLMGLPS